jgi:deoxycytidine triphosphate deaminase
MIKNGSSRTGLDQVSGYIKEKLEQKQKIDEKIEQSNNVLQSKNVNIETINEYIRLNEKLMGIMYLFMILTNF